MWRARIAADQRWVDTAIDLAAGRTYVMSAEGEWWDEDKRCGPDGYRSWDYPRKRVALVLWLAVLLRRVPRAKWLALVGEIHGSGRRTRFTIGSHAVVVAPHAGRLRCFANDARFAYENNRGHVDLTVTEQAGAAD